MKFGYARVSSAEQNENRQIDILIKEGINIENIYIDKKSGKDFERTQYKFLFKILRAGDVLTVTSLDRFGRNYEMIKNEYKKIIDKNVEIRVLDMPLINSNNFDETGVTGKFVADLVLSILSYVAENERLNIRNRQVEGIQSAKRRGVKFGRPKKCSSKELTFIREAYRSKMKVVEVCRYLKISKRTYYNYLNELIPL